MCEIAARDVVRCCAVRLFVCARARASQAKVVSIVTFLLSFVKNLQISIQKSHESLANVALTHGSRAKATHKHQTHARSKHHASAFKQLQPSINRQSVCAQCLLP